MLDIWNIFIILGVVCAILLVIGGTIYGITKHNKSKQTNQSSITEPSLIEKNRTTHTIGSTNITNK